CGSAADHGDLGLCRQRRSGAEGTIVVGWARFVNQHRVGVQVGEGALVEAPGVGEIIGDGVGEQPHYFLGARSTGLRAAAASSKRRRGARCGAVRTFSGSVSASRATAIIASTNASIDSLLSDSVGSIISAPGTTSGK